MNGISLTALIVVVSLVAMPAGAQTARRSPPPMEQPAHLDEEQYEQECARVHPIPFIPWKEAVDQTYLGQNTVYDLALAAQLLDELYVDRGHWYLNQRCADYLVLVCTILANDWPEDRLPAQVREYLAAGLVEYVQAGGGRGWHLGYFHTAEALTAMAPFDPVAQAAADELLYEALLLAVQDPAIRWARFAHRACRQRWGEGAYLLRVHEAQFGGRLAGVSRPERYEQAVAALNAVTYNPPADQQALLKALRDATQLALYEFSEAVLNEDLTCRLLIAYHALLARRPMVHPRVSGYIEDHLLRMASDSLRTRAATRPADRTTADDAGEKRGVQGASAGPANAGEKEAATGGSGTSEIGEGRPPAAGDESSGGGRRAGLLITELHWELWSGATLALGPERVSERGTSFVRSLLKRENLPQSRRKWVERLHPLLEQPPARP